MLMYILITYVIYTYILYNVYTEMMEFEFIGNRHSSICLVYTLELISHLCKIQKHALFLWIHWPQKISW